MNIKLKSYLFTALLASVTLSLSKEAEAQSIVGNNVQIYNNLRLKDRNINRISNDSTMIGNDSLTLPTEFAVRGYIDNKMQGFSMAIGHTFVVPSQDSMLNLAANIGDVAVIPDSSSSYILKTQPPTDFNNWVLIVTPAQVVSAFGRTGNVTAQYGDYDISQITGVASALSPYLKIVDTTNKWLSPAAAMETYTSKSKTTSDSTSFANSLNGKSAYVASITALENYTGNSNTVIVQDAARGGTFNYTSSATPDSGTVFNRFGGGFWKRQFSGSVNVKWFDVKGDGSTIDSYNFQKALNYRGNIIVPSGNYLLDNSSELAVRSNTNLILDNNATLFINANSSGIYTILSIRGDSNVTVSGGNIVGDRQIHIDTLGEFGMGITIDSSTNVVIQNINISNCWGDGIYIGGGDCRRILVDNVKIDNSRRQGISITNANGVIIRNSYISRTNGTAPQSALDLEPNSSDTVFNINLVDLTLSGNVGSAINAYNGYSNASISNISMTNIASSNNGYAFYLNSAYNPISNVSIIGSTSVSDSSYSFQANNIKSFLVDNFTASKSAGTYGGVSLSNSSNGVLSNLNISDTAATHTGISLISDRNISISASKINTVNYAIFGPNGSGSYNISIKNNDSISSKNSVGIFLNQLHNSSISGNGVYGCGAEGIKLYGATNTTVDNNFLTDLGALFNNAYAAISIEDTSNNNKVKNNTIRNGIEFANKIANAIKLTSSTFSNFVSGNDLLGAGLSSKISNAGTDNAVVDSRYSIYGPTSNRPTSPPTGWTYYNTTTGVSENWNGSAWVTVGYTNLAPGAIANGTTAATQNTTDSSGKLQTTAGTKQIAATLFKNTYLNGLQITGVAGADANNPGTLGSFLVSYSTPAWLTNAAISSYGGLLTLVGNSNSNNLQLQYDNGHSSNGALYFRTKSSIGWHPWYQLEDRTHAAATYTPQTTTVNTHPLSGNVTVTYPDIPPGAIANNTTVTTQSSSDSTDKAASTAFVKRAVKADSTIIFTARGIKADTMLHPGYVTLVLDSAYVRDSVMAGSGSSTEGSYTPTITGVANYTSGTASVCQYIRNGNTVTVYGKVTVKPTAASTITTFSLSLPPTATTNFTSSYQGAGIGGGIFSAEYYPYVITSANGAAALNVSFISNQTSGEQDCQFTATYQIQ